MEYKLDLKEKTQSASLTPWQHEEFDLVKPVTNQDLNVHDEEQQGEGDGKSLLVAKIKFNICILNLLGILVKLRIVINKSEKSA